MAVPEIDELFGQLHAALAETQGPLFDGDRSVYVYGAGSAGRDVARILLGQGIAVAGFLDRKAVAGSTCEGLPLLTPESPATEQRALGHVIIGIFNCGTAIPPIVAFLRSLGYGQVTTFLELHDAFPQELGTRFWLTGRNFYADKKEPITAAADIWADKVSRDLYLATLHSRFTARYDVLPEPTFTDQYFPTDLPPWPGPIRFVDCGAYDGDTLRHLMAGPVAVEAVACFEPDPVNYLKLADSARAFDGSATLALFPCGVGAETVQLGFAAGNDAASRASDHGDTLIQCVALDDALPGFRPGVIKMDIEGAEVAALHGARRMIERDRPGLAISVYHDPDHLWVIPLLLRGWLKGGRHYLRSHGHAGFDLIYYWIP